MSAHQYTFVYHPDGSGRDTFIFRDDVFQKGKLFVSNNKQAIPKKFIFKRPPKVQLRDTGELSLRSHETLDSRTRRQTHRRALDLQDALDGGGPAASSQHDAARAAAVPEPRSRATVQRDQDIDNVLLGHVRTDDPGTRNNAGAARHEVWAVNSDGKFYSHTARGQVFAQKYPMYNRHAAAREQYLQKALDIRERGRYPRRPDKWDDPAFYEYKFITDGDVTGDFLPSATSPTPGAGAGASSKSRSHTQTSSTWATRTTNLPMMSTYQASFNRADL